MAQTILTPIQQQILNLLSKEASFVKNFYLTGGTALSEYYLHHRLSEDLDFFTAIQVDKMWLTSLSSVIAHKIKASKDIQESFNRNLVFFRLENTIIKTEFTYFPMPQINPPTFFNNIPIDSELDIAVNKFFTIYQKPSARHFIDLYLLLSSQKYTWDQLKKLARTKFDTHIDPLQLGSQLVKAQDIPDLPRMLTDLPENSWRGYFLQKAQDLRDEIVK